jgi:hypothetical protein
VHRINHITRINHDLLRGYISHAAPVHHRHHRLRRPDVTAPT